MADPIDDPQDGTGDEAPGRGGDDSGRHGGEHRDAGTGGEQPRSPGGDEPPPSDPLSALFAQLGLGFPAGSGAGPGTTGGQPDLTALLGQLNAAMGSFSAPGNGGLGFQPPSAAASRPADEFAWLKDMVRRMSAGLGPDPSPTPAQQRQVQDVVRLVELWLDEVVDMAAVSASPAVWSRAEWIEQSFPSLRPLAEPVIRALASALGSLPEEGEGADNGPLDTVMQMLAPMMEQLARQLYGAQFAQAVAHVSRQVTSASDVGLQLAAPRVALLADNIERHYGELDVPDSDVWVYMALREAARQRLFAHVSWLGPQLQALVEHYARETRIDLSAIESSMGDLGALDPARLGELGEQLQGKLFDPEPTPEQAEVLQRLQTTLALVEGWVEHVVSLAAAPRMPNEAALSEAVRRRRASGASEDMLRALVGLELKPRRVRDAANLWAALHRARGSEGRDALWAHPDLLPTAAALDDPLGFADPESGADEPVDEWDLGLQQLLREEGQDGAGPS